jgi:hypothetical protein
MKDGLIALLLTLGIGYTIYKINKTDHTMKKTKQLSHKKDIERELKTDPRTGLLVFSGPSFTKEDIARDFPKDSDRDSIIIRRSVGL